MSNKSLFKKYLKGIPAKPKPVDPRSEQEINTDYTRLAQQLGDVEVKMEGLKKQREAIFRAVDNLGAELNARKVKDNEEQYNKTKEEKVTREDTEVASKQV